MIGAGGLAPWQAAGGVEGEARDLAHQPLDDKHQPPAEDEWEDGVGAPGPV